MRAAAWIVVASVGAWLAVAAVVDRRTAVDVLLGMAAPAAVVSWTWVLIERAHARQPERLTALLIKAFGAKVVFFGTYVMVVLGLLSRRPAPFMIGFTASFIALYFCEAMLLRRMLGRTAVQGTVAPRG